MICQNWGVFIAWDRSFISVVIIVIIIYEETQVSGHSETQDGQRMLLSLFALAKYKTEHDPEVIRIALHLCPKEHVLIIQTIQSTRTLGMLGIVAVPTRGHQICQGEQATVPKREGVLKAFIAFFGTENVN